MNIETLKNVYHLITPHWPVICVAFAWLAKDCKAAWQWLGTVQGIGGVWRYVFTGSYDAKPNPFKEPTPPTTAQPKVNP